MEFANLKEQRALHLHELLDLTPLPSPKGDIVQTRRQFTYIYFRLRSPVQHLLHYFLPHTIRNCIGTVCANAHLNGQLICGRIRIYTYICHRSLSVGHRGHQAAYRILTLFRICYPKLCCWGFAIPETVFKH